MLNEFIEILLGCIHEYVNSDYWHIVDAISVPVFVFVILVFSCVLVARAFTAVHRSISGK